MGVRAVLWRTLQLCIIILKWSGSVADYDEFCGDHLTSPRGTIQSPNFPGPFEVPIKCRWVIDVSELRAINSSIVVYLNQLYVYKGLKFTEYAYYESESMNFDGTLVKEITEGNVFEYKWIRTFRPFLVIEFELDRLEGNNVRVLNGLLDVHGFNVTYEMTEDEPNSDACSANGCSFGGNCLVSSDYTTFLCDCFDGFTGINCHDGPLCFDDRRNPVCQNGGTCRQIGAEAMQCHCLPGFVGRRCEIQLLHTPDNDCAGNSCTVQCPHSPNQHRPCNCINGSKIYNNRSRFECRIRLSNITSLRNGLVAQHGTLESFLSKQLAKYLRSSNISSVEDLKILNVTLTSEVTFHFFGNSDDGDKIRESLNRIVQRRKLNEIALESTHFTFQQKPALKLQSLRTNQVNEHEVHLGDQLTLSCIAQGSYGINFTWYKDNMSVNISNALREIWYKDLPSDGSDVHTSILTIEKATLFDTGQYTCRAVDWGVEQCRSIYIEVKDEPDVKVVPMSATIDKGSNIQLTCTTPNMHSVSIGFGWTKNRALLKLEPGCEVWEDLYPAGSILKITNAQKSAIYTCNVAHRSMSVRVEVVNRTLIPICSGEKAWSLWWPDTAPGSEALLECPRHFVGKRVSRLCSMKDATTPEWQIPDFSGCLYEPLILPYNNFRSLTLGYQNTTGSESIVSFWEVLRSREIHLYPGEGDRILGMLAEIERYQLNTDPSDLYNSAEAFTRIINRILSDVNSILTEQKLLILLQLTQRNLMYWTRKLGNQSNHLSLSSMVLDIQQLQPHGGESITYALHLPNNDYMYPNWYGDRITVRLWRKKMRPMKANNTISGTVVLYRNITQFLPNAYMKELDDGTDLEYRINSRLITVAVSQIGHEKHMKVWMDLQMQQLHNHSDAWNISCGLLSKTGSWDLDSCIANTFPGDVTVYCHCPTVGTIALFSTARAVRVVLAKKEQTTFIVICGCASCLIQCALSLVILLSFWWKNRTWLNFLKLQCCAALAGAMAIFIYAVHDDLPENLFSFVAISLEALLLVGMSAPISQVLIVYANLVHVRPSQHLQPTVIAVITGVPVLAVLTTELAHQSTGSRHESWWLIYGSGVYNIFVTCATIMLFIFMVLYMGVLHKAHVLIQENVIKREILEARIRLLRRAAVIVCGIIAMAASSIFYINSTSIIFHYVFASLSAILGFIVFVVYIVRADVTIIGVILSKFKWKPDKVKERSAELIKVCSKVGTEVENDGAAPPAQISGDSYLEVRGIAVGSIDVREFVAETSSSYAKPSVPPVGRFLPKIRIDHSDDINLENYSTSPRKYQETMTLDSSFSSRSAHFPTESYTITDCCSFRDFGKFRDPHAEKIVMAPPSLQTVSPECSSSKVLCSADVESRLNAMPDVTLAVKNNIEALSVENDKGLMGAREHVNVIPDIANTTERKQPDGEEVPPDCEATTSGMLDRISHDLDYLLNRTQTKENT